MAEKLGEFSLAWKDENSDDWIDGNLRTHTHRPTLHRTHSCAHLKGFTFYVVSWLLPDIPLRDQGVGGSNLVLFR